MTEKTETILDEMPDTKMTDLSQTRQYNSYESIGDDTIISCGSMQVGNLSHPTVGGSDAIVSEDNPSQGTSPVNFVEPSPVKPRNYNESPSCSRRSLSMEVDDQSERNSQSDQPQEPMDVSITLISIHISYYVI